MAYFQLSLKIQHCKINKVTKLVMSKCLRLGLEEKKTLDHELKILSVVIQKGNARLLVGRQIFTANEENIPDVNVLNY